MGKVIYIDKFIRIGGKIMKYDYIEQFAAEVLDANGFYNVIVDPVKLANSYNIEVKNAKFVSDDISGMLKKENGKTTIYVNSFEPINRKRFTVAHELGHYFLNHLSDNDKIIHRRTDFFSLDIKEIEANAFAAALLMEQFKVKDLYNKLTYIGVPIENIIVKLSDVFKVSRAAVKIRLKNLGLINE
jgi:Zn-dependent peptidase ImmA (M78 family)